MLHLFGTLVSVYVTLQWGDNFIDVTVKIQ